MKNISALLRTHSCSPFRKTYGNVNMVRRKDLRRLKKMNVFHREVSGEQNTHSWFTSRRLKALGNTLETARNNHIGTNPMSEEMQAELSATMPEMAHYQYWNYRNRMQQLVEYGQKVNSCDIAKVISLMPSKLRKQIQNAEEFPTPQIAEPLLKYSQQLQVYLPQDERYRYNIMQKIDHPAKIKMEEED